tara:strand:- start:187 stop:432 length:246 start_codon:yes stop_codon:yes gene_type:complete
MKTVELKQKLEEKELKNIQELNSEFAKLKIALGEVKLHEADLIEQVRLVKSSFVQEEKKLVEKYGAESVIDLRTGEVTKKE